MSPGTHERFERLMSTDVEAALAEAAAIGVEARATGRRVVAVSACLLGERVRPDGTHKYAPHALAALEADPQVIVLPVCPEVLARLGVPRPTVHCGTRRIHGPGGVQEGSGVFAARLARRGVRLGSEVEPLAG